MKEKRVEKKERTVIVINSLTKSACILTHYVVNRMSINTRSEERNRVEGDKNKQRSRKSRSSRRQLTHQGSQQVEVLSHCGVGCQFEDTRDNERKGVEKEEEEEMKCHRQRTHLVSRQEFLLAAELLGRSIREAIKEKEQKTKERREAEKKEQSSLIYSVSQHAEVLTS